MARADQRPQRPGGRGRIVFLGLVLLLFGLPLTLATIVASLQSDLVELPFDEQAGGTLRGFVNDPDDRPLADVPVEAFLVERVGRVPRSEREPVASTRTDAEGTFALDVPPVDGCYELVAGGEGHQRRSRPVGIAGEPIELVLARGGRVRVELVEAGVARGSGSYTLVSRNDGWKRFFLRPNRVDGTFEDGVLVEDGLAAGAWLLEVRLEGGVQHVLTVVSDPTVEETSYRVER